MKPDSDSRKCRVVLGVSSVGKSHFIQRLIATGAVASDAPVIMASDLENGIEPLNGDNCLVHYNALRPFQNDIRNYPGDICNDQVARVLFDEGRVGSVDVLVASRATIVKRVLLREGIEPHLRAVDFPYPNELIFEFLSHADLADIYAPWIEFLQVRGIPLRFHSTEAGSEERLDSAQAAMAILRSDEPGTYSAAEREKALSHFSFPYQSRDGGPRRDTLSVILPHIAGSSVLDVGCAEGFFCFSLEQSGFADVVGTELKRDRFLAACAMRDVMGSKCRFLSQDIFSQPLNRSFDVILLLNVLHHLRDPIGALEILAKMCNRRLILEYPTLADPKFADSVGGSVPDLNGLPLIGVSDLEKQDQTYLFTDSAIRRICVENSRLFSSVEFLPSPVSKARRIAVLSV